MPFFIYILFVWILDVRFRSGGPWLSLAIYAYLSILLVFVDILKNTNLVILTFTFLEVYHSSEVRDSVVKNPVFLLHPVSMHTCMYIF